MLADDLVGAVALDPRGAGVPVGHVAFRIEQEDGVVGDALDQNLEAPFALVELACGALPQRFVPLMAGLRQVAIGCAQGRKQAVDLGQSRAGFRHRRAAPETGGGTGGNLQRTRDRAGKNRGKAGRQQKRRRRHAAPPPQISLQRRPRQGQRHVQRHLPARDRRYGRRAQHPLAVEAGDDGRSRPLLAELVRQLLADRLVMGPAARQHHAFAVGDRGPPFARQLLLLQDRQQHAGIQPEQQRVAHLTIDKDRRIDVEHRAPADAADEVVGNPRQLGVEDMPHALGIPSERQRRAVGHEGIHPLLHGGVDQRDDRVLRERRAGVPVKGRIIGSRERGRGRQNREHGDAAFDLAVDVLAQRIGHLHHALLEPGAIGGGELIEQISGQDHDRQHDREAVGDQDRPQRIRGWTRVGVRTRHGGPVPCPTAPCLRPMPVGPARAQGRRRAAVAVGRQVPCSPSRPGRPTHKRSS